MRNNFTRDSGTSYMYYQDDETGDGTTQYNIYIYILKKHKKQRKQVNIIPCLNTCSRLIKHQQMNKMVLCKNKN